MGATARREAKRKQVLAAARQLFLERGFDGASTDAIAARARVSKETLYRYHRSKEALLVAVMREMAVEGFPAPLTVALPPAATRRDLEAALLRIAEQALDRLLDPAYLTLVRLALAESGRRPQLGELFRTQVPDAGSQALRTFLEDARRRGLLRPDLDPRLAARVLIGPVLTWGLLDGLLRASLSRPSRETLEQQVRLFLDGAAAPPGAGGAPEAPPLPSPG
jgi:TetR/AcrR family transcriptional regulator, mexJK operon transcriptional repressor